MRRRWKAGSIFLHVRNLNQKDVSFENSEALIVLVPQGDVKATANTDCSIKVPRKVLVYAKDPVPKTDTGGWVEYTKVCE